MQDQLLLLPVDPNMHTSSSQRRRRPVDEAAIQQQISRAVQIVRQQQPTDDADDDDGDDDDDDIEWDPVLVTERVDGQKYRYRGPGRAIRIWSAAKLSWMCVRHRRVLYQCSLCHPRPPSAHSGFHRQCHHGRRASMCVDCGGPNICPHHHIKFQCKQCNLPSMQRRRCQAHNRNRYTCRLCRPPADASAAIAATAAATATAAVATAAVAGDSGGE